MGEDLILLLHLQSYSSTRVLHPVGLCVSWSYFSGPLSSVPRLASAKWRVVPHFTWQAFVSQSLHLCSVAIFSICFLSLSSFSIIWSWFFFFFSVSIFVGVSDTQLTYMSFYGNNLRLWRIPSSRQGVLDCKYWQFQVCVVLLGIQTVPCEAWSALSFCTSPALEFRLGVFIRLPAFTGPWTLNSARVSVLEFFQKLCSALVFSHAQFF